MKDNNVVAFYCNNCHETVLNCEHNFEQLHEKGLCAKCLKNQNKTKDKWQKLKEWLDRVFQIYLNESDHKMMSIYGTILDKMRELEGEDE